MNKKEVYEYARERARAIILANSYEVKEFIALDKEDEMWDYLYECEDIHRQYSPFDFIAHDINESDDPEGYWEKFDQGTEVGFNKGLREIKRSLT